MTGTMETELFEEFFRAVSHNAGMTLHIKLLAWQQFTPYSRGCF